jgi:hypothetical protein
MCLTMKGKLPGSREGMLFFKLTVGLSESMMHATLWELRRLHERRCFNNLGACHHGTVRYPNQYQPPEATARLWREHVSYNAAKLTAHRPSGKHVSNTRVDSKFIDFCKCRWCFGTLLYIERQPQNLCDKHFKEPSRANHMRLMK